MNACLDAALAMPTVRAASDGDAADWDAFVLAQPSAGAFHRWGWRDVLAARFGHRPHFLVAERDGRIEGVLPLVEIRSRLFGHSLGSLPFCPYAGPVAGEPAVRDALIDHAIELARSVGAAHLELRGLDRVRPLWPAQDLYVTFRRAIVADHDRNLDAIPRKQRAMVRKGIKNGLSERIGDLDAFFGMYCDNVHRHGTPGQSKAFFRDLQRTFGPDCEVLTVHARDGRAVSGVVTLYFRDEVLPYFAGDTFEARELAANDFKYWRVMCRAAERGCSTFDFGRSKLGTGPYNFKRNWGFEPHPLAYEYWLSPGRAVPQNNPLNPRYRLMIETWRRLPRPFVQWLGPKVVGALG